MSKVRKAVAGGFAAGVAAISTGFSFTGTPTTAEIGKLIGLFVGGFFVGFVTVYATKPNITNGN